MIKLDIAEYCHNCPEFDPIVTDDPFSFNDDCGRVVECGHAARCCEMYYYIKKEWEENHCKKI